MAIEKVGAVVRRELLIRCDCGTEIVSWTTWVADAFNDDEEHWIEIITKYQRRGLRQRVRAFLGRYEEAVIVQNPDAQKIRDFLNEVVS